MSVLGAIGTTGLLPGTVLAVWTGHLIRCAVGSRAVLGDRLPSCAVRVRHPRPRKPGEEALAAKGGDVGLSGAGTFPGGSGPGSNSP